MERKGWAMLNWISGWGIVICGGILVGVGGVLATLGWDNIGSQREKKAILRAICREWWLNNYWIARWPLKDSIDPNEIQIRCTPYNHFEYSEANTAKTSHLIGERSDNRLPLLLANYVKLARDCNILFDDENKVLGRTGHLLGRENVLERLENTRETPPYSAFEECHIDLAIELTLYYKPILKKAGEDLFPDNDVIVSLIEDNEGTTSIEIYLAPKQPDAIDQTDKIVEIPPDGSQTEN